MKKSVNNKSFDDIFAQRGEQVDPEKLKEGQVYFAAFEDHRYFNAIVQVRARQHSERDHYTTDTLRIDGGYWERTEVPFGWGPTLTLTLTEATPDQIDLLNSYR